MAEAVLNIDLGRLDAKELMTLAVEKAMKSRLNKALDKYASQVLKSMNEKREGFAQFTGNTVSSFSVGIYEDGAVRDEVSNPEHIVAAKIPYGDVLHLVEPVEGDERAVMGDVELETAYGQELSDRTIDEEMPQGETGLVVATGVEYAEMLENKGANVLTGTFDEVRNNALGFFKKELGL